MNEPLPNTDSIIKPTYTPSQSPESATIQNIINALSLIPHIEGGYYAVTHRSPQTMPSPYPSKPLSERTLSLVGGLGPDFNSALRSLSTCIYYYLTPNRPMGSFHRNRSRIIHTLHRGRGRYVLIHPSGQIESFVVGHDIDRGEKMQWIVEGGVWKASFLLDGHAASDKENEGLLITETVVPGFEFADHEFLTKENCKQLLSEEKVNEIDWLIKH